MHFRIKRQFRGSIFDAMNQAVASLSPKGTLNKAAEDRGGGAALLARAGGMPTAADLRNMTIVQPTKLTPVATPSITAIIPKSVLDKIAAEAKPPTEPTTVVVPVPDPVVELPTPDPEIQSDAQFDSQGILQTEVPKFLGMPWYVPAGIGVFATGLGVIALVKRSRS